MSFLVHIYDDNKKEPVTTSCHLCMLAHGHSQLFHFQPQNRKTIKNRPHPGVLVQSLDSARPTGGGARDRTDRKSAARTN